MVSNESARLEFVDAALEDLPLEGGKWRTKLLVFMGRTRRWARNRTMRCCRSPLLWLSLVGRNALINVGSDGQADGLGFYVDGEFDGWQ